ncbi:MAG: hypothetical protein JO080_13760 [Mucilaginibacter sp.]|nr:hypothetical protein [Mucilaginibacter sp.]
MRFVTIILFLLSATTKHAHSVEHRFADDTSKHSVNKRNLPDFEEFRKKHKPYFDDCAFTNKYSIKQRLTRYPFSKAVKIIAVSYPTNYPKADIELDDPNHINDSLLKMRIDTLSKEGLHVKNGDLNYSSIREIKILNKTQINKLTDIIYNTDYKVKVFNVTERGMCFDPRNALVFFDKDGKVFDYLEICFECLNAESKSDKITVGTLCTQKYEILRKYLISLGIKYGTVNKN